MPHARNLPAVFGGLPRERTHLRALIGPSNGDYVEP
jgi:hypothetical protein